MNEVINEVKALRNTLDRRIAEAEETIKRLEAVVNMFPEDSAAGEDIVTTLNGLYDEVRIEKALKNKLSLCEFCKLSPALLCDKC